MDIPLHPAVVNEMACGREFLDRVRAARRGIANTKVVVFSPDGNSQIMFGGDGMVVDAAFTDDVFDRYPGDKLGDLLTAMCEEGFGGVSQRVSAAVAEALGPEQRRR
jgi:hypothetical protein